MSLSATAVEAELRDGSKAAELEGKAGLCMLGALQQTPCCAGTPTALCSPFLPACCWSPSQLSEL